MTLTFGIIKNKTGYQAECLENPDIVACGWTWEQLINTIIEHTEAWAEEMKNLKYNINRQNTDVFCGFVKVEISNKGKARVTEENTCK